MNLVKYLFVTVFSLISLNIESQSINSLKELIDLNEKQAIDSILNFGFDQESEQQFDGCNGYKFVKDSSSLIYNICKDAEGDLVNINIIDKNLERTVVRLNELKKDLSLYYEKGTICGNTSHLFIEDGLKEIYLSIDHFLELYVTSIANNSRYEFMKEMLETKTNYDDKNDIKSNFMNLLNVSNKDEVTIEKSLEKYDIQNGFGLLNIDEASDYLIEFRKTSEFDNLKEFVNEMFLTDKSFVKQSKKYLNGMQKWLGSEDNYVEFVDEYLFRIALENNKFRTMIILDYLCEKLNEKK